MAERARGRWLGCLALGLLASSCLVCGGAALARSAIATHLARQELLERGIECDERFAVQPSWTLDEAIVTPSYCTVAGASGAVESFELIDPLRVAIEDRRPARIDGGAVRVTVREAAIPTTSETAAWGPLLAALAFPERVGVLTGGLSQLAASEPPPIALSSIEIVRAGDTFASLAGVSVDGAAPLGVRVDRIALPTLAGPLGTRATASITALESTATPARVELRGALDVDAALSILGTLRRQQRIRIVAAGLDTTSPTYHVEL